MFCCDSAKVALAVLLTFVELRGQTLLDAVSADESLSIFLSALRTHGRLQNCPYMGVAWHCRRALFGLQFVNM